MPVANGWLRRYITVGPRPSGDSLSALAIRSACYRSADPASNRASDDESEPTQLPLTAQRHQKPGGPQRVTISQQGLLTLPSPAPAVSVWEEDRQKQKETETERDLWSDCKRAGDLVASRIADSGQHRCAVRLANCFPKRRNILRSILSFSCSDWYMLALLAWALAAVALRRAWL